MMTGVCTRELVCVCVYVCALCNLKERLWRKSHLFCQLILQFLLWLLGYWLGFFLDLFPETKANNMEQTIGYHYLLFTLFKRKGTASTFIWSSLNMACELWIISCCHSSCYFKMRYDFSPLEGVGHYSNKQDKIYTEKQIIYNITPMIYSVLIFIFVDKHFPLTLESRSNILLGLSSQTWWRFIPIHEIVSLLSLCIHTSIKLYNNICRIFIISNDAVLEISQLLSEAKI